MLYKPSSRVTAGVARIRNLPTVKREKKYPMGHNNIYYQSINQSINQRPYLYVKLAAELAQAVRAFASHAEVAAAIDLSR